VIEVRNVKKYFKLSKKQLRESGNPKGDRVLTAVNDVSFTCSPGRIFSLLGPNGAGKTTMLRMIATMLKPDSGSITVDGNDTVKSPSVVREKIGFLTGSTGLYSRLSPLEITEYYGKLYGLNKKKLKERRDFIFNTLGIDKFANRRIGKLSSGMKQKVSIARTLIHNPGVVIFDEPTTGLDVITSRNIMKLIRDCRQEGKSVIFSTHIMGEVNMLSDDLAILHHGNLLYNGTFADFKSNMRANTFEEEFIRVVSEEG